MTKKIIFDSLLGGFFGACLGFLCCFAQANRQIYFAIDYLQQCCGLFACAGIFAVVFYHLTNKQ